ncbi:MAG TPA: DUF4124 domain-containing protein [Nevskiaceae bacterium]
MGERYASSPWWAMSWLLAAAVAVATPAADAAVYQCTAGGQTRFTDQPCLKDAPEATLPILGSVPAAPAGDDLARRYDERTARDRKTRDQASAEWIAEHERRRQQSDAVRRGLVEGRVVPGMTPAQVESVLGVPARRVEANGVPRSWTFINGRTRHTVDFAGGVVKRSVTRTRRRR